MLLKAGVPVKNASGRIGHRDAATTLDVYAHTLEEVDHASSELIGQCHLEPLPKRRRAEPRAIRRVRRA